MNVSRIAPEKEQKQPMMEVTAPMVELQERRISQTIEMNRFCQVIARALTGHGQAQAMSTQELLIDSDTAGARRSHRVIQERLRKVSNA
jgi:hypothetical protein